MKWEKALKQIETALADNKEVEIKYHRKWAKNVHEYKLGTVESIVEYEWYGDVCKRIDALPSAQPESCEGCKHLGKWINEVEYGYPSPCTHCKRKVEDHYER